MNNPQGSAALRRVASALLDTTLSQRGDLLALKDSASGVYLYVNDAMAAWIGRSAHEVVGCTDANLFDADLARILRSADVAAMSHGEPLNAEHKFEHRGQRYDFGATRLLVGDEAGARDLCVIWHNLSFERQKEQQLRLALEQLEQNQRSLEQMRREMQDNPLRDSVTGLYSKPHFDDQLKREIDLSSREQRQFALVMIELDPLRDDVQAVGEPAVARVFEQLGRLLRSNTRAMDGSCRYDESRFGVLLSGVGLATAHIRMEGLRRQCVTHIVAHEGRDLGFTVSMGVASFPHTADEGDALMEASLGALADAKRRGGNQVALATIKFEAPPSPPAT